MAFSLADRAEQLWQIAWDQHVATATKHKAAFAAAETALANAKAAPGSPTDFEHAKWLWRMLRTVANIAIERCDEADGLEKQP